ncbi:MAG: hypothetical protein Q4E55_03400 [Bacteroidales bacterium]|nr:hypothetical protein [Bacteroidales bacterium]
MPPESSRASRWREGGKTHPKELHHTVLWLCHRTFGRRRVDGCLAIAMHDNNPHRITSTRQEQDAIGQCTNTHKQIGGPTSN